MSKKALCCFLLFCISVCRFICLDSWAEWQMMNTTGCDDIFFIFLFPGWRVCSWKLQSVSFVLPFYMHIILSSCNENLSLYGWLGTSPVSLNLHNLTTHHIENVTDTNINLQYLCQKHVASRQGVNLILMLLLILSVVRIMSNSYSNYFPPSTLLAWNHKIMMVVSWLFISTMYFIFFCFFRLVNCPPPKRWNNN